jgi:hypothetical protein
MQHFYETRYIIDHIENSENNGKSPLEFDIEEVCILLYGESDILVISLDRWTYIALIEVNMYNINELLSSGAKWVKPSNLYKSITDVKIQMAYICAKYLISPEKVYDITAGLLTKKPYTELVKMFYDEWPEKFI